MTGHSVSVIVVSRHRPAALRRSLVALTQQDHPEFEVIVVADPEGLAAVAEFTVKSAAFDEANISVARNAGLALASGQVVAFIDDDSVAEPTWLSRLVAPFADETVNAATGFVRGRNGISRQWGAAWVDRQGGETRFDLPPEGAVFDAEADRALKTQGTNCAFRRTRLLAVGGFDPAYRFYHDETDVNLRMRARTAVVPMAQVVHLFGESERRRADRVPKTLIEIGASSAVFLRRHAPDSVFDEVYRALRQKQMAGLMDHAQAARLGTTQVWALLQSFDRGWAAGMERALGPLEPLRAAKTALLPLPGTGPRKGLVIAARLWQKKRRQAEAQQAVKAGRIVTLFCLSLTARPHWQSFSDDGYWLQQGGIFGRSLRSGPRMQFSTLKRRVAEEALRCAAVRPVA